MYYKYDNDWFEISFVPLDGAAERVLACNRSRAVWLFLRSAAVAVAAFLGLPRFLLPSLRPLVSSLARRGLGDGFTARSEFERSSSTPDSCCVCRTEYIESDDSHLATESQWIKLRKCICHINGTLNQSSSRTGGPQIFGYSVVTWKSTDTIGYFLSM